MNKLARVLVAVLLFTCFVSYGQATLSQQKPERLYQDGIDLLSHQEYGAAYKMFGDFLQTKSSGDARIADATYYRAFCALNLYHADGEKQLEEFIAAYPLYPKAATAYYDLASFFYTEKNYGKASAYFSKVDFGALSNEQQNTGRFRWGYALFSQKDLKGALDQFNTIKAQGGQYGPASSYYAGFIESSSSDYTNAMIDLKRAESNPSYATIVPVLITNVYYRQNDDAGLLSYSETALTRENVSSADEISLLVAETYFRKGEYTKALTGYTDYLESHEKNADRAVYYRAGFSAASAGNGDLALTYLKAAALNTDSIGVYASYALGLQYLKRQEKPLALTAFDGPRKYKKDKKLAEESLFLSAKINYEIGRADEAINQFEQVLKEYPESLHGGEIRELLSQAYVNANNYNKAIEYIEALPKRSLAVERAYQKATYLKGTELFNKEDFAGAVGFFEKSLQNHADTEIAGEASFWCGETYSVGRRYEQAIPHYEQALGSLTNPALIKDAHYGLGYARFNLQQYDRALINFREFVNKSSSKDVNYLDGMIRLADCYYVGKSYSESLANYRKAIQLNSGDAEYAHLQCGIILRTQRKYSEAAVEFETVMRNPSSRYADDATYQRAQVDFEQSNYAGAVNQYSKLIASSKSPRLLPYALTKRAASYFNLKKYDQTANDYITVLEKFPTHPVAQDLLIPLQESLNLAGRTGEFDKYLAQVKAANPGAKGIEPVEFEAAKNLYFNQNYAKAIENLKTYIAGYPESPRISEAKYYEAESYYRLKDFTNAMDVYQQVQSDLSFSMLSKVVARVGELEFKSGKYEEAVKAFHRLDGITVNKKEEAIAWSGLMETYYLLAQYDSVNVFARKLIEQGSVTVSTQNKASLYLGKSAMAKGDYETAKDEFLTTLNTAHDEYGAEAKYLLGEIFFLNKEYKQCYETLLALNTDFANYTEWVGKSYLLLADNFLAMGEVFQAKGTLKSLVDKFPEQSIRDQAAAKLKAIEADEAKKNGAVKTDSTSNEK